MTTITDINTPAPEPITVDPPRLVDLLSTDAQGQCIPEAVLDDIWPRDDREPLLVVGKGVSLPHTCTEFVPCYERFGEEACLKFVFNGSGPAIDANVPLGDSMVFALTASAALLVLKARRMLA